MSLQGNLDSIPLADVMQMIASNGRTGTLYVVSDEASRILTFQKGRVTTASSLEERFLLGTVLCQRGIIDPESLEEALQRQREESRPLGVMLFAMGLVTEEALRTVLQDQVQSVMNDVFRWREGGFLFAEHEPGPSDTPGQGFSVQPLLMEALRTSDEWQEIAERFHSRESIPRHVTPDEVPDDESDSLPPGADDALAMLEMIDGFRSIEVLVRYSGWGEHRAITALAQLADARLIALRTGSTSRNIRPHIQLAAAQHLPVEPRAGARAVAICAADAPSEAELMEIAFSDPGLAAALMRTAGELRTSGARFQSVSDALAALGSSTARRALVGAGLRGLYVRKDAPWPALWRHAMATSVAARAVARAVAQQPKHIEVARLAGLLHDAGCYMLRRSFPDRYPRVLDDAAHGVKLIDAERRHLDLGHDSLGAKVLESWGADPLLTDAVLRHHTAVSDVAPMTAILTAANALANKHGFRIEQPVDASEPETINRKILRLPPDTFRRLERTFVQICAAREPLW